MALVLNYFGETNVPVEVEGFTPDWACDKSLAEIERFEIFDGNRKVPLAQMFRVSGNASDKRFDFEGNLAGVHWIGAHMTSGQIHLHGPGGRHIGSRMQGGEIHVHGERSIDHVLHRSVLGEELIGVNVFQAGTKRVMRLLSAEV